MSKDNLPLWIFVVLMILVVCVVVVIIFVESYNSNYTKTEFGTYYRVEIIEGRECILVSSGKLLNGISCNWNEYGR